MRRINETVRSGRCQAPSKAGGATTARRKHAEVRSQTKSRVQRRASREFAAGLEPGAAVLAT